MSIGRWRLRSRQLDLPARGYAERLSAQWRVTGLEVSLIECISATGEPERLVLTARSASAVLICSCRAWLYGPPWSGRPLWTVRVSVRRLDRALDGGGTVPRVLGVAAAADHEQAWQSVLDWIEGRGSLHANLEAGLAAVRLPSRAAATLRLGPARE